MRETMPHTSELSKNLPFWSDGKAVTGMVFVLTGAILCWEGLLNLRNLWIQFQPFFPLALPSNVSHLIINSFPVILNTMISTIASFCAILVGSAWAFAGLLDVVRGRRRRSAPADLHKPEWVVESLISAQPKYGRSFSLLGRIWTFLVPQIGYMSPVRYQLFREVLRSFLKIAFLAFSLVIAVHLLRSLPSVLNKSFHLGISFSIPSPSPLYCLLGLIALIDLLIAASLVSFRRGSGSRSVQTVQVRGSGDPNLFLALLEESLKLLTPKGCPVGRPMRLEQKGVGMSRGTLMENCPRIARIRSLSSSYLCLPLVILSITVGFSSLIRFQPQISAYGELTEFLSKHGVEYVFQVSFSVGLIFTGIYFSSWSERLFNIRKFRSDIVFCSIRAHENFSDVYPVNETVNLKKHVTTWRILQEVDEHFVGWEKKPKDSQFFSLQILWAEMISESMGNGEPRFVIDLQTSESLDRQIWTIMDIPFCVNFERIATESVGPQTNG